MFAYIYTYVRKYLLWTQEVFRKAGKETQETYAHDDYRLVTPAIWVIGSWSKVCRWLI